MASSPNWKVYAPDLNPGAKRWKYKGSVADCVAAAALAEHYGLGSCVRYTHQGPIVFEATGAWQDHDATDVARQAGEIVRRWEDDAQKRIKVRAAREAKRQAERAAQEAYGARHARRIAEARAAGEALLDPFPRRAGA